MHRGRGSVIWGMFFCWLLNLAEIVVGLGAAGLPDRAVAGFMVNWLVGGIGLVQLFYVLPLFFMYRQRGNTASARGMAIAASITALFNVLWWVHAFLVR